MEFPLGRRQEAHKMKNILISFSRSEQKNESVVLSTTSTTQKGRVEVVSSSSPARTATLEKSLARNFY